MKRPSLTSKLLVLCAVILLATPALEAKGKLEFGFHYGSWGINIVKGIIESAMADAIKNQMVDKNKTEHPDLVENYANTLISIDSSGYNYGFEMRWYPGGENGSFSLGLSVEQTSMKASITNASADISVSFREEGVPTTASISGTGSGDFMIKPLSFHLSFRWDIKPSLRFHPYITFGFGIAPGSYLDKGTLTYDVHGTMTQPDGTVETFPEDYTGPETKTFKSLREENPDADVPFWFVPFIQLNLGLKGKITNQIHVLVDVGIWDGFLLRGGIAVRI